MRTPQRGRTLHSTRPLACPQILFQQRSPAFGIG